MNKVHLRRSWHQGLNSSSIPYIENQLAKPKSWDSMALSIFLFATSEFFEINLNNISTLLFRMADFIRNRKIHSKTEKDISIIVSFGQAA